MSLSSALSAVDLSQMSLEEMAAEAYARARAVRGNVVTYSPKVFIPLTQLCRDRCGYCTFAQAPARVSAPFMSLEEVMEVAQAGRAAGVTEALFGWRVAEVQKRAAGKPELPPLRLAPGERLLRSVYVLERAPGEEEEEEEEETGVK